MTQLLKDIHKPWCEQFYVGIVFFFFYQTAPATLSLQMEASLQLWQEASCVGKIPMSLSQQGLWILLIHDF